MLSRAAEQLLKETSNSHRKRSECGNISHIYTDQQLQQPQQNAKKSPSNGLFQNPPPRKNVTFGWRHIACMLYITHYPSISHMPISLTCVDYRPIKSSLSFFCHAVTPCLSRLCRVLCRNVDFLLTYTEKKIIRLYNNRERIMRTQCPCIAHAIYTKNLSNSCGFN